MEEPPPHTHQIHSVESQGKPYEKYRKNDRILVSWRDTSENAGTWDDASYHGPAKFLALVKNPNALENPAEKETLARVQIEEDHSERIFPLDCLYEATVTETRIDSLEGKSPVIGKGTINKEPFLFRCRGTKWTLHIGGEDLQDKPRRRYEGTLKKGGETLDKNDYKYLIEDLAKKHCLEDEPQEENTAEDPQPSTNPEENPPNLTPEETFLVPTPFEDSFMFPDPNSETTAEAPTLEEGFLAANPFETPYAPPEDSTTEIPARAEDPLEETPNIARPEDTQETQSETASEPPEQPYTEPPHTENPSEGDHETPEVSKEALTGIDLESLSIPTPTTPPEETQTRSADPSPHSKPKSLETTAPKTQTKSAPTNTKKEERTLKQAPPQTAPAGEDSATQTKKPSSPSPTPQISTPVEPATNLAPEDAPPPASLGRLCLAGGINILICPGLGTFLLRRPLQAAAQLGLVLMSIATLTVGTLQLTNWTKENLKPDEAAALATALTNEIPPLQTLASTLQTLQSGLRETPQTKTGLALLSASLPLYLGAWSWGCVVLAFPKRKKRA